MLSRQTISRAALAAIVGAIAMVALSSSIFSAIVCGVTLAAVVFDITAQRDVLIGYAPEPIPKKLTVDLSRRSTGT
jgi:hypothetical protein